MVPKLRCWDKNTETMWNIESWHIEDEYVDLIEPSKNVADFTAERVWRKQSDIILMQSTGLKDNNGVEIFVGDIVILTSKSINYADTYWHNYVEVFQQPNGAYRLRGKGIYETELYGNRKQVTLTGNIYETPELLENDRFCTETDDPDY